MDAITSIYETWILFDASHQDAFLMSWGHLMKMKINAALNSLTASLLLVLLDDHFSTSFFGDW